MPLTLKGAVILVKLSDTQVLDNVSIADNMLINKPEPNTKPEPLPLFPNL